MSTAETTRIEGELLDEVQQEMKRRGSSILDTTNDLPASLSASAILACLAVLAGTGVMMALTYTPSAGDAHASVGWLEMTFAGALTRAMHFHASNLLILLSGAYIGYMLWRGLYRKAFRGRFWRAGLLLALALAAGFTGQLLPYDQNALHGTLIRVSYIESVPVAGPVIAGLLSDGELGTATLTRFFGLHVLIVPVLLLILLRWFRRDAAARGPLMPQLAVPLIVVALITGVSLLIKAPLGLAGTFSEPYADARPEWYAIPLFELLKLLPAGTAQLLALIVPPAAAAVAVVGLPLIEKATQHPPRLLWPVRIGLIAGGVIGVALTAMALISDFREDSGWFRKHETADAMLSMGARNDALGNEAEALPHNAHNHARDLMRLHERIIGRYPAELDQGSRSQWDDWAREGAARARDLLLAPDDAAQRSARARLREVCQRCHEAEGKEEVPLNPPPRMIAQAGNGAPAMAYFFDQQRLSELKPTALARADRTTKRVMEQSRNRLRDILTHAGVVEGEIDRDREQALVDLRSVVEFTGTLWESNAAAFWEEEKWENWAREVQKQIDELAKARSPEDIARTASSIGQACESCHDGADELGSPIEWRYRSLLE